MKAAVLGAEGCLGARLIESFQLDEGPTVAAIASHPAHLTRAARFSIDLRVANLLDADSLAHSFAGCSVAVHAATLAASELKRGATAFCRAGAQAGMHRLIYISSADVHGLNPPAGTTEKSSLHGRDDTELIAALVAAERQFASECRALNIAGIVLRPGLIYGARSPFFAQVAEELMHERAWLIDQGKGVCNCVALDNVIMAIRLALKVKIVGSASFLLTDDETVTWREFYQAVALGLQLPLKSVRFLTESTLQEAQRSAVTRAGAVSESSALSADKLVRQQCRWKLPIAHARNVLGLINPVPFAEGMNRAIAWWRFAHGDISTAA
jgi:nucleoside-diphosphate-sugar epimerase